jgi:ribosomal protein L40E
MILEIQSGFSQCYSSLAQLPYIICVARTLYLIVRHPIYVRRQLCHVLKVAPNVVCKIEKYLPKTKFSLLENRFTIAVVQNPDLLVHTGSSTIANNSSLLLNYMMHESNIEYKVCESCGIRNPISTERCMICSKTEFETASEFTSRFRNIFGKT